MFFIPFLKSSIPASLSFGLTPYLPHLSFDFTQFDSLSSPASPPPLPPKEIPVVTSSLMVADSYLESTGSSLIHHPLSLPSSSPSSLDQLVAKTIETAKDTPHSSPITMQIFPPSIRAFSVPYKSMDKVDIF